MGETADQPWLSRGFLREYVGSKSLGQELLDDAGAWQQPLVRDHFPPGLRDDMVRLHHDREWFVGIMETLPRALSHLDHWPANVRSSGRDSALFDWAFTGDGALGEDIGNYIPDAFFDLFLPAARLPELASTVYEAYVNGLREGGWRGDERLVRLGVCASAVKYDWLTALMLVRAGEEQHAGYGGAEAVSPNSFTVNGDWCSRFSPGGRRRHESWLRWWGSAGLRAGVETVRGQRWTIHPLVLRCDLWSRPRAPAANAPRGGGGRRLPR